MSATPPAATEPPGLAPQAQPASAPRPSILSRLQPADGGIVLVAVLWLVLTTHRLAQNGFANIFYSAGVKSMLHSLHNFLFVSFDQGGLVSVDKPPLALWLQVASAKVFGFHPLSLLLPEAICGLVAVLVMYVMLRGRVGGVVALGAALALAVFPSFVAISRDNGVDPLLLALLVLACWAALRACDTGSWWALVASAVLVGLAFNTKTLAAYLAVPGIVAGYLVCAPSSVLRRIAGLALAGVVMFAVSFGWILYVDSVAAAQRPWVGSTTDNSEVGLDVQLQRPRARGRPDRWAQSGAGEARRLHPHPPRASGRGPRPPAAGGDPAAEGRASQTAPRTGPDGRAGTAPDPVRQVARAGTPVPGRAGRPGGLVPALRAGRPGGVRAAADPRAAAPVAGSGPRSADGRCTTPVWRP